MAKCRGDGYGCGIALQLQDHGSDHEASADAGARQNTRWQQTTPMKCKCGGMITCKLLINFAN